MPLHELAQRITTLNERLNDLAVQYAALQQQRSRAQPGSDDYVNLSGQMDAVAVDYDDALADLRQLRRQRRELTDDLDFFAVYRPRSHPPGNQQAEIERAGQP